ncbi:MAG TPA: hypothetical protein VGS41_13650 [Chthonomonadales bacterium]|nr:hypothetical protein [Chthonomonadales bacterium]
MTRNQSRIRLASWRGQGESLAPPYLYTLRRLGAAPVSVCRYNDNRGSGYSEQIVAPGRYRGRYRIWISACAASGLVPYIMPGAAHWLAMFEDAVAKPTAATPHNVLSRVQARVKRAFDA